MKWISSTLALAGLLLSAYGAVRVAFRGLMGANVNYFKLGYSLLFDAYYQGSRDTNTPLHSKRRMGGLAIVVRGLVLQALSVALNLYSR